MNMFFIIFFTFFLSINYLVGQYYVGAFSLTEKNVLYFWIGHSLSSFLIFLAPLIYRIYPRKRPGFFYNALQWIGYTLFGLYSILFVFVLFNLASFTLYDYFSSDKLQYKLMLKSSLAILSVGVALFVTTFGFFQAVKNPAIKRVKIPIAGLPDEFDGITLLQLSDIHVGQTIKRKFVRNLVKLSNEMNPDIVVLTGDLVDGIRSQLEDELEDFKEVKAKLGKFMVPGNHEYYWGVQHWIHFWQEIGFSTLVNSHMLLEKNEAKIVIAGVHDYSAKRIDRSFNSSPALSLEGAPKDAIKILLAHQPRSVYEASQAGFHLQLSGHTHSGQYFPFNFLVYLFQPFVKGLNRYKEMWIYVNQGTGHWGPPNRFGVPPEVTLIELIKA